MVSGQNFCEKWQTTDIIRQWW